MLKNRTTNAIIATRVDRADSWLERAIGFFGRRSIGSDDGLWLDSCKAIHTHGLREEIDIIFLDSSCRVLELRAAVRPWSWVVANWRASAVVELGPGTLRTADVLPGDYLDLV